jgi:aromatic ring hydroxylase
MGARTGQQFLDGLRKTPRQLDRQHRFAAECLVPDPVTGEPINISHAFPRSVEDLKRRNRGLSRIAEATVGLMGRTPDYMNVKFASFAARPSFWAGPDQRNARGAENLVRFQKRLAREDVSLTHTIIQPTVDKATDAKLTGNRVALQKIGDTAGGIVVRGAKVLATLAPFADELAVYPSQPLPPGADAFALAFSVPVDAPGLIFLCRDSASAPGAHPFDRPLSSRFDEQDAVVIFDDVEIARDRVFLDGDVEIYNGIGRSGIRDNMTNQSTLRALTKLEFAYGLATRMAEAINDQSPATLEMLGELSSYVEVTRSAVLLSAGSHNLLPTPSRAQLDDAQLRPLLDEFLGGAGGVDVERRAALFRLAWDFVGSGLGGRNVLYERFYLTSASRNRINTHLNHVDRTRACELVDSILAAGRSRPAR